MKKNAGFRGVWRHAASCTKASALPHLTASLVFCSRLTRSSGLIAATILRSLGRKTSRGLQLMKVTKSLYCICATFDNFSPIMPNTKQKRLMQEEKRRRATAAKESAETAANQFEEQQMRQLGQEADQRGEPLVFPKMPVKMQKRAKWKEWKPGESTDHLTKIES